MGIDYPTDVFPNGFFFFFSFQFFSLQAKGKLYMHFFLIVRDR